MVPYVNSLGHKCHYLQFKYHYIQDKRHWWPIGSFTPTQKEQWLPVPHPDTTKKGLYLTEKACRWLTDVYDTFHQYDDISPDKCRKFVEKYPEIYVYFEERRAAQSRVPDERPIIYLNVPGNS